MAAYIMYRIMYMQTEMAIKTSKPYYLRMFVDEAGFLSQLKQRLRRGEMVEEESEIRSNCQ